MNILCLFGFHSYKNRKENYTIGSDLGAAFKTKLDVSTCNKCGKRRAYTVIKEYSPREKKYWKDWSHTEGSTITWSDLNQ
jgi:hypothetical protein